MAGVDDFISKTLDELSSDLQGYVMYTAMRCRCLYEQTLNINT